MMGKIKGVIAIGLLAVIMAVLGVGLLNYKMNHLSSKKMAEENKEEEQIEPTEVKLNGCKVVIDPGHGGYDPGKVGINGALEKDVNLAISLKVESLLRELGYEVIMTRETDTSMKDNGSDLGKVQDLEVRVQTINNSDAQVAISIHQNSYITENVKGAQVFYYEHSDEGKLAAQEMQKALLMVDETNHRSIKENTSYYLLKRTEVPTIIVECGFLSNYEESEKLCNEEYQNKLADSIVQGIENYIKSL